MTTVMNAKPVENANLLMLDVEWVKQNVEFIEENRGHFIDEDEASKHHFTKFDQSRLKKRIKFYTDKIFKIKPAWKICCPMIIYLVDNKYYLADGQGRFLSVVIYNNEAKDKIKYIPSMIVYNKTYEEMIEDMMDMNRFNKNWSTADIFRCQCLMVGDTSLCENMHKIQEELDVKEYTAKLILFGYTKSSHRDDVTDNKYSPYKDVMFNSFKKFYEETRDACYGNQNEINTIKKQDCAQALYKILAKVIRICEENNVSYDKKLNRCLNIIIKFVNELDRKFKFKQVLGGKQNSIGSHFAEQIINHTSDEYIRNAMRNVA